jgi:antitoxin component YwqK of YwqJK toxin-antitoxin module
MIGYKVAKNDNSTRVLITLKIPEDAITNINRSNIVVKETAKHRANKVKVIKIEDADGKQYNSATSFWDTSFIYKMDDTIVCEDFDMNLEKFCSTGIHFFLTRRCAELYDLLSIENGIFEQWYETGQPSVKCIYKGGLKNGLYQQWYDNGQKTVECLYINDKLEGEYKCWYYNRQLSEEIVWKNGIKNGSYRLWNSNGQKKYEANYIDDNLDGLCQGWNEYGHLMIKTVYKRGVIVEV